MRKKYISDMEKEINKFYSLMKGSEPNKELFLSVVLHGVMQCSSYFTDEEFKILLEELKYSRKVSRKYKE